MIETKFENGEVLLVCPSDGDDPEATAHAGQTCTFIRYADAPGKLASYAVVHFEGSERPVFLRDRDLARKGAE